MDDVVVANLAGFFDGEGSVCILQRRPKKSTHQPGYFLALTAAQLTCRPEALNRLKARFGGCISNGVGRANPISIWSVGSDKAVEALKAMAPYLATKWHVAIVGLMFGVWKQEQQAIRRRTRRRFVSDDEVKTAQVLRGLAQKLNRSRAQGVEPMQIGSAGGERK